MRKVITAVAIGASLISATAIPAGASPRPLRACVQFAPRTAHDWPDYVRVVYRHTCGHHVSPGHMGAL